MSLHGDVTNADDLLKENSCNVPEEAEKNSVFYLNEFHVSVLKFGVAEWIQRYTCAWAHEDYK